MRKVEEVIYQCLGTQMSPNDNRDEFLNNFKNYIKACEKVDCVKEFYEKLKSFFIEYPDIKTISFKSLNKYSFNFIKFFDIAENEIRHQEEKMVALFRSATNNSYDMLNIVQNMSHEEMYIENGNLGLSIHLALTEEELDIYNKVEYFEKNKLEILISLNSKKSSTLKV